MTRKQASIVCVLVIALAIGALPAHALPSSSDVDAAALDDNVPGVPIPASPVAASLDSVSDPNDVYNIWLSVGDTLSLSLTRGSTFTPAFNPNLYLYNIGTVNIDLEAPIAGAESSIFPKALAYAPSQSGTYYVNVFEGSVAESGEARLYWSVSRPVFRFYNMSNGTHFYTASTTERDTVTATWPHIYRYEGEAYRLNPYTSYNPLYRFYHLQNGSHFYTASEEEKARVMATWPHIYRYEGPAYNISTANVPGSVTVWRFFNLRNGSHFYTVSAAERDYVAATWPTIYRLEGPAFYLPQ